ncbi:uncharacterized protein LOC128491799 isoform X2 [Spea bombifrons]|uniref:uncharacterized protein LOC128491799 isoform X2 n=1 Tax=Spea bombifrons TaxID=233779 RepID=UPI002349163C|nr:uncharacterized protein LOC128491799 isoform X2 [Spea bombifrons]
MDLYLLIILITFLVFLFSYKCYRGQYLQMYQTSSVPHTPSVMSSPSAPPVQAWPNLMLSPSVKQYSKSVFLYSDPSVPESDRSSRPLLLFLPWLGSKARAFEKYILLYFKLGFDVLVAESSLSHFLWPKNGLDYAGQLVNLLMTEKDFSSRSLFVHAVSIGGYTFAQMLVWTSKSHGEQRKTLDRIHGQVYDSLVVGSMERMATGVAGMVSLPFLKSLVARGTLLYFNLLKSQTVDYYENGIQTFWNMPLTCPALFFYCMDDPLSDHTAVEQLKKDWEKRGIKVQSKKWNSSLHAGHLRRHPQEYTEELEKFILNTLAKHPKSKL